MRVIFENVIFACQCGRLWAGECRLLGNESEKKDVRFFYLVGEFLEKRKMKEHSTSFFMVSLSERPEIDQKEGIPICCDASSY